MYVLEHIFEGIVEKIDSENNHPVVKATAKALYEFTKEGYTLRDLPFIMDYAGEPLMDKLSDIPTICELAKSKNLKLHNDESLG